MNNNIDINEVRKYNASLKEYQQKASQVRAGIEYNQKELARLCEELSKELGIQVTPDNVAQIREAKIQEIENSLRVGNQILERIKNEEKEASQSTVAQAQVLNQSPLQSQMQRQQVPQAPQAPQAPNFMNTQPAAPNAGTDWGSVSAPNISVSPDESSKLKPPKSPFDVSNIPPMFGSI